MIYIKKYINYLNTLNELKNIKERIKIIDNNNIYLENEKNELIKLESTYKEVVNNIDITLKQLKGIEYNLFYEIIVNNLNVTKAVDKVAFNNDLEVSTIWKNYYPNVKRELDKLIESK